MRANHDKIVVGDVITFFYAAEGSRHYGLVVDAGAGAALMMKIHPHHWLRIRWLGKSPYNNDCDIINKTTNLVNKYVCKEQRISE